MGRVTRCGNCGREDCPMLHPATKEVRLSDDELRALCRAIAGVPDCEDLRRKLATCLNVETIVTGPQ